MPIQFEGKTVGAININSFQKNAFDEEELRLLEIVAHQIETAINNAQSAEALHKAKEELEIRVEERTRELARINEELKKEIAWRMQAEKQVTKLNKNLERRAVELEAANRELEGEVSVRKSAEGQIKASLKEKEVLLKEIQHRVKNNLQVISSLLDLQTDYVRDKRAFEMFNEAQNRVRSMALIHEAWSQSKDLSRVDFAEYVRNLGTYLFRSYGVKSDRIELKINADNASLSVDNAVQCGLIINELVSNSLKHAFPRRKKGEISVGLHQGNGKSDSPCRATRRVALHSHCQ